MDFKTYEWNFGDEHYKVDVNFKDRKYQLTFNISDSKTKELHTFHRAYWREIEEQTDDFVQVFIKHNPIRRQTSKIVFDICERLKYKDVEFMIASPLFKRYYLKPHCNYDIITFDTNSDIIIPFNDISEIWLSCDNCLNVTIMNLCSLSSQMIIYGDYLRNYEGDDQFNKIIEIANSTNNNIICNKIYRWVYRKVKKFHTKVFGKEINNYLRIMSPALIKIILDYLI